MLGPLACPSHSMWPRNCPNSSPYSELIVKHLSILFKLVEIYVMSKINSGGGGGAGVQNPSLGNYLGLSQRDCVSRTDSKYNLVSSARLFP